MIFIERIVRLLLVVIIAPTLAYSAEKRPPSQYHISDVTISLEHSMYAYSTDYSDSAVFHGTGEVQFHRDDSGTKLNRTFQLDRRILQGLVRDLYEINFFDLEDGYTTKPELRIDSDGNVRAMVSIANHQWNTSLTVRIRNYEKRVRFDSHGVPPSDLKAFAERLKKLVEEYVPELREP